MSIWDYANPKRFMSLSGALLPYSLGITLICLSVGLIWGFFLTPNADKFESTVKIIYIHVPSAFMAISVWTMMVVTSLIWLIRRHHVSALAAKAAAPIGLIFTLIGLYTGAVWAQPMWGSWWEWEPRLTSFLILCLFYFGYMALWSAIEDPDTAADLTSVLCLVGSVFAFLSRYAVFFWDQGLHQGASLSLDKKENVSDVYWFPLLICMAGFFFLFVTLVLLRTRTEIRQRRIRALLAREQQE